MLQADPGEETRSLLVPGPKVFMTWRPPKDAARRADSSSFRIARPNEDRDAAAEPSSDRGEFAEIAKRHHAYLQRAALRLTGNRATAEDLVQEALWRGMRNFHQFRQGSNARTWLSTILTHLFLDHCKHEKVVGKATPDLLLMTEETDVGHPLISGITDDELWAAVRGLDPELREVVELCYLRQMKYREIAERLGVPVGTIGTRLLRARDLLRQSLTTRRGGGTP